MRKKLYFAVAFLLGGVATLFAQQELHLVVNDYSGRTEIPVSQITDITFSSLGDRMTITKTDNSQMLIGDVLMNASLGRWDYAQMSFEMLQSEPTAVVNTEASSIMVYPNPTADVLYIKGVNGTTPSVYTAGGKAITLPVSATADGLQLNTVSLPQGVYYISVNNQYVKFIKK